MAAAYPADFNGDGKTDLIAAQVSNLTPAGIAVWLGRGDGGFDSPIETGLDGFVLATGRLDADTRTDAVVYDVESDQLLMLPGLGDGRFGAAVPVATFAVEPAFVKVDEFTGDGGRDLAVGHDADVSIYPGHGDGTFGPRMTLPPLAAEPVSGTADDFDGDGSTDLAVTDSLGNLTVYRNNGGLLFEIVHEVPLTQDDLSSVISPDLDGDAVPDLVVAHTSRPFEEGALQPVYTRGGIEVLRGLGDGTFGEASTYFAGEDIFGPLTVVAGDFNEDGLIDLATGNRSIIHGEDDGVTYHYWDSISILPGLENGDFGDAAVFRLNDSVDVVHHLKTSDVDGDGRTDLIAAPGIVAFSRPAADNHVPAVDAGEDRDTFQGAELLLDVTIVDPDSDWVSVEWRRERDNALVSTTPDFWYLAEQTETLVVTVRDARGGVGTDSVVVRVDSEPGLVVTVDAPAEGDVHTIGEPMTIRWSAPDDAGIGFFRLSTRTAEGGFGGIPGCADVPATDRECPWSNPGPSTAGMVVVVEAYDSAGRALGVGESGTFTIQANPDHQLPWPWQQADIGAVGTAGSASYADGQFTVRGAGADIWGTADAFHFVYQELPGNGDISAAVAVAEGAHAWTKVGIMIRESLDPGAAHHFLLASRDKGLAYQRRPVTGGTTVGTNLGAGSAASFSIRRTGSTLQFFVNGGFQPVATATMPEGRVYVGFAVTSHDPARVATGTFGRVNVQGGSDLPPGVHVSSPTDDDAYTAGNPVEIEFSTFDDHGVVRIDLFAGEPGKPLVPIDECTNLPPTATTCTWLSAGPPADAAFIRVQAIDSAGLQSSDDTDDFTIRDPDEGGPMPEDWSNRDVGDVAAAGSATYDGGTGIFTVSGSGADIWNTADEFHFVSRLLAYGTDTPVEITARVTEVENVDRWTKVGLMVRSHTGAGAAHASVFVTPTTEKGLAFQRRPSEGALSVGTRGPAITAPVWLRLRVESGVATAYYRQTETDPWAVIGQDSVAFEGTSVEVGLAVSSHVDGTLATARFDDVLVSGTGTSAPAITITSPTSDTPVTAGEPLRIEWFATGNTPVARYDLFAGGFDAPLDPIEECFNLPGTVETCTWNNPGPAGPSPDKFVVVRATDTLGRIVEEQSDTFVIRDASDGGPLPAGWSNGDVGDVAAAGTASYDADAGRFIVSGSGADIWNAADEFHFVSRAVLDGGADGLEITARIAAVEHVDRWTKVGLMIRAHRGAASRHASIFVTPTTEKGINFQRRRADGAQSVGTRGPAITAPVRLRLVVQSGGRVQAYYRIGAGDPWTFVGEDEISFSGPVEIGLAVSSHVDGTLASATFDQVSVQVP